MYTLCLSRVFARSYLSFPIAIVEVTSSEANLVLTVNDPKGKQLEIKVSSIGGNNPHIG